jgi:DNA-binding NarL/FixJ family response regulator
MPEKARILFVDDEPKVLSGLKRALRAQVDHWDMEFFDDPKAALAAYSARPFNIVISDLAMPEITGLELILAMRRVGGDAEFILLTGTGDFNTAIEAINRADIHRFFTKPCPTELLVAGIASALTERRPAEGNDGDKFGLAALNRLAMGVVVVDESARLLFANTAGARILSEKDGLLIAAGDTCRAADTSETATLHDLIRRVCADALSADDASGLAITRPSLKRPLIALIGAGTSDGDIRQAIIFVFDPERQTLPQAETIARLFGLSPAEGRLVHALAEGRKLEDAAQYLGLTVNTARTYLKQVFSKTGTGRQSELLKLVLTASGIQV